LPSPRIPPRREERRRTGWRRGLARMLTVTSFPWIAVPTLIGIAACLGYWAYSALAGFS
jgi:hypothetical protein